MKITSLSTDAELIHSYLNGNINALQHLIVRYQDKVYTSIYILVKDKYLAEDIFQDTFLKIAQKLCEGQYAEQGKFLPWASRIARNLCMDYFRHTHKKVPIINSEGKNILEYLNTYSNQTPEPSIEQYQTSKNLRHLLEALPYNQREVIVMRIYGDMSFKDIAKITNVSINTALGRMRYGLMNLRKKIEDYKLEFH